MRPALLCLLLLAACAPASTPALSRGAEARPDVAPADDLLRVQLATPPGELREPGWSVVRVQRFFGALASNGYSVTPVDLPAGNYLLKAACARGCDALELRVSAGGVEVARAPDGEDYRAAVRFSVAAPATHQVRVDVRRCGAPEPCGFGFAVFAME
jgi:hypothetical protein